MAKQSEQILEEQLIVQLQKLGYTYVQIEGEVDLLFNLKRQLEKHNESALKRPEKDNFQLQSLKGF